MFLEMTSRHDSPWGFAASIRKIKDILKDAQSG